MTEVLQRLHAMRWDDNSMGSNFLYDWAGINQAFAAGQIGMYVSPVAATTARWSRRTLSSPLTTA